MTGIRAFLRENRLYILLAILVLIFATLMITAERRASDKALKVHSQAAGATVEVKEKEAAPFSDEERARFEKIVAENRPLAIVVGLVTLLIFGFIFLGIVIDLIWASAVFSRKKIDLSTQETGVGAWGIVDVMRVVILFLFFGYMLVLTESFLVRVIPAFNNDNLRMILNTSILDLICIGFVIYFVVVERKGTILSLGLTSKNFGRNIFYGIASYLAAIPIMVVLLALLAFIVQVTKYIPERQPVVELFLKEKDGGMLLFTSVFAAICGPFVEEIFFRSFMYKACKKLTGAFWAVLITSAVFAALHTNLFGFLPILLLGVLLQYMYEKTGTLVAPITIHIIHNLGMVMFVFLIKQFQG